MKIPKALMTTMRRTTPDDEDALELSSSQTQQRLSKQIVNDKERSIVNRNQELKRAKGMLDRTQDPHNRKRLRKRIDKLERENIETKRFL